MTKPVVTATTLVTDDGVPIDAIHLPGDQGPRDRGRARLHAVLAAAQRLAHRQPAQPDRAACSASTSAATAAPAACPPWATARSGTSTWWSAGPASSATSGSPWSASPWAPPSSCGTPGWSAAWTRSCRSAARAAGTTAAPNPCGACTSRWSTGSAGIVTRRWLKTRISPDGWKLVPVPPAEAAAKISPVPLLIVHGDQDHYFPPEHARQLYMAANEPKELWLMPGHGPRGGCRAARSSSTASAAGSRRPWRPAKPPRPRGRFPAPSDLLP